MSSWRWCITRQKVTDGIGGEPVDLYELRELYVSDDGALSWTEDPISPSAEAITEMAETLMLVKHALRRPILDLTLDPPALVSPDSLRNGA